LVLDAPNGISPQHIKFLSEEEKPAIDVIKNWIVHTDPVAIAHVSQNFLVLLLSSLTYSSLRALLFVFFHFSFISIWSIDSFGFFWMGTPKIRFKDFTILCYWLALIEITKPFSTWTILSIKQTYTITLTYLTLSLIIWIRIRTSRFEFQCWERERENIISRSKYHQFLLYVQIHL
jgi:hypothetical protein